MLAAIRPHVTGRLHVIFGCGGDRDKGKRPLMGVAAARFADDVILTDDNPRSENPAQIRKEALAGAPDAKEIGDRTQAIHAGIAALKLGDALVIAGKGHESGQIVGNETRPFLDRDEAIKAALSLGESGMNALWTSAEAEAATLGRASHAFEATGLSIDTRTLKPGDLFVALKGDARDGHEFVCAALRARAAAALVSQKVDGLVADASLLSVANTLRGLEDLGRASRTRTRAKVVAVTGSAGKTTTKEMLRLAFGALGKTHASSASYNNHWGVPLSLASMAKDSQFGIFEIGMNHFGEIRALVGFVRPHVALVTTIAPAHLEFFGTCEAIADAKSEIFEGIVPGGVAIVPADNPYASRLLARAKQANVGRILTFGAKAGSDAKLVSTSLNEAGMKVKCEILGRAVAFRIGAPGSHIVQNAIATLLSVAALEGDVLNAAAALETFAALKGRGARFKINLAGGEAEVIDESYNANPASMSAAFALLGAAKVGPGGKRIAAVGDMLEMGADAPAHHAALARDIEAARVDQVFANGPSMKALWDALPHSRRGAYGSTSAEVASQIAKSLHPGDVILVKGSLGSKMSVVIDALKTRAG